MYNFLMGIKIMNTISKEDLVLILSKINLSNNPIIEITFDEFTSIKMASKYVINEIGHTHIMQNNIKIDATIGDIICVNKNKIPIAFVKCHQNYRSYYEL